MNANKFLPPPVRLSQAFEPGGCSGGASGSEITRRSFIKRTGGATVATLVAWNVAAVAEVPDPNESFSLGWLHITSTRWRSLGAIIVVRDGHPEDEDTETEALWQGMGNEQDQFEVGNPSEYEPDGSYVMHNEGSFTLDRSDGVTTYTYGGPITLTHIILRHI